MANELDELTGPINSSGNSNSKIIDFFGTSGIKTASKSFGIVGTAALKRSNAPITIVVANNNDAMTSQEMSINKPLVKMINVLVSIDGVLKQRIDNQKIIAKNAQLAAREDIVENRNAEPQIEEIKPDAEKAGGSSAGLLALGGLALLTLDPVQDALKAVIDGVISAGSFITGMVSSVNNALSFLLGSNDTSGLQPSGSTGVTPEGGPATEQTQENRQSGSSYVPPAPESPGALGSPTASLSAGGLAASVMAAPLVNNPQASPAAAPAAAPVAAPAPTASRPSTFRQVATRAAVTAITAAPPALALPALAVAGAAYLSSKIFSKDTPSTPQAQQSGIPRNDSDDRGAIVRLGQYLQTQGINVSQHPDFGPVGQHTDNSRHYRALAIDLNVQGPEEAAIFDALQPQLRAAGYNTIWRAPGHETHMHVSVGGPEGGGAGGGDYAGMAGAVSSIATASIETIGKLFGALGSVLIEPGIPRRDIPSIIGTATREFNSDVATRSTTPPSLPDLPTPPRITNPANRGAQGGVTPDDTIVAYYYIRRFGYQNPNGSEALLMRNTVTA